LPALTAQELDDAIEGRSTLEQQAVPCTFDAQIPRSGDARRRRGHFARQRETVLTSGSPGARDTPSDAYDAHSAVIGSLGSATYSLAVPAIAALAGFTLHQQALVVDPAAGNPLGFVLSDAATAVVGL
jgi:hypothetical protein